MHVLDGTRAFRYVSDVVQDGHCCLRVSSYLHHCLIYWHCSIRSLSICVEEMVGRVADPESGGGPCMCPFSLV